MRQKKFRNQGTLFDPIYSTTIARTGMQPEMSIFNPDTEDPEPQIDDASRLFISRKLKELYDSVQHEEIPDRFLDLLEKLDEVERASAKRDGP